MIAENKSPNKTYALAYGSKGYKAFPCHKNKQPMTAHGFKDATADPAKIIAWWDAHPDASIGIATEGVLVLDVDAKNNGHATLAEYEAKHGKLPLTPTAKTGSGGLHYWLKKPLGTIKCKANIAPGFDIRTDGGYVIVPPSENEAGAYAWLHALTTPLADAPAWLIALASEKQEAKPIQEAKANTSPFTFTFGGEANDFASHPGSGEGERNATLCRLAGVHLSRNDSPATIEALALAWAKKCNPPYAEVEVKKSLNNLFGKSIAKGEYKAHVDDDEETPLPSLPTLQQAAYHGVIGEYVKDIEPHTEADPAAILLSALVTFGSIVGRSPSYAVEADAHHANLFLACVGNSGHARKGASLRRALALFDEEYCNKNIISGLSSGEGIIAAIRDAKITIEEGVAKILDAGVDDKRILVCETELAQTLKVLRREGNTLSPILRLAYDGSALRSTTKSPMVASNPHVSIVSHITRQELSKCLSDTEYFNGFGNRFLWAYVQRSKSLPEGGEGIVITDYRKRIAAAAAKASTIGTMVRSPDAKAFWHEVYSDLEAERNGLAAAMTMRGPAMTLRLSMIYALADSATVIERSHLEAAYAVWQFCVASACYIFGDKEQLSPIESKLLGTIKAKPGLNRKGLYDALNRNVNMGEIAEALASLRDKSMVYAEHDNKTGGRPCERWYSGRKPLPTVPRIESTVNNNGHVDNGGVDAKSLPYAETPELPSAAVPDLSACSGVDPAEQLGEREFFEGIAHSDQVGEETTLGCPAEATAKPSETDWLPMLEAMEPRKAS